MRDFFLFQQGLSSSDLSLRPSRQLLFCVFLHVIHDPSKTPHVSLPHRNGRGFCSPLCLQKITLRLIHRRNSVHAVSLPYACLLGSLCEDLIPSWFFPASSPGFAHTVLGCNVSACIKRSWALTGNPSAPSPGPLHSRLVAWWLQERAALMLCFWHWTTSCYKSRDFWPFKALLSSGADCCRKSPLSFAYKARGYFSHLALSTFCLF